MGLLFENLINENRDAFIEKVKYISVKLLVDPNWLMAVMYKESKLNHRAVNSSSGATGLIQFMPSTAKGLGTSTSAIKSMTNLQQLDLVYKYFFPYVTKLNSYPDLYLATFFPIALGKGDDYIMRTSSMSPALIANSNPAIDLNKDKQITIKEFKEYCYRQFDNATQIILKKKA